MKKKFKVAVIGLGWVGLNRHLPTIHANSNYEVIGVIDRHPGKAREIAMKKHLKCFAEETDLGKVMWLKEAQAVIIATAPQSHYALIKSALELNMHVLTEKPFTMSVKEGIELVEIAKKKDLVLGVIHNFQFASSAQRLIRDLERGAFGKIKSISATQLSNPRRRLPKWYETLPLGLFYDESPHFFYLISKLSPGTLKFLKCDVFQSTVGLNTPSLIDIKYKCESNEFGIIPVSINMNFEATISEWHITVFGENYVGDIDIFRDMYICLPNDGLHVTGTVFRTSILSIWQHLSQHFTSGIKHLFGSLRYGNDIVFERFAQAVIQKCELKDIGGNDALNVLMMQHDVIEQKKVIS